MITPLTSELAKLEYFLKKKQNILSENVDSHFFCKFALKLLTKFWVANADTISIIVTNKYSEDIFIGEDYYIAKFNGKKWVRLPLHYAFVDIGYKIPKGESKSFTINLQKERYKYY